MMPTTFLDDSRIAVWEAMADHFLDTETRQWIPKTALTCVKAGYTLVEARDIWRFEVTPAVRFNLLSVAGEWAGWDREWLVDRILGMRSGWFNQPGIVSDIAFRLSVGSYLGDWVAIERCIAVLRGYPPAARGRVGTILSALAAHYFDFAPPDLTALEIAYPGEIRGLYEGVFLYIVAPVSLPIGACLGRRRIERALASPV